MNSSLWSWLPLGQLIVLMGTLVGNTKGVRFNHPELHLSANRFEITNAPRVRHYDFVITNTTGAPDGYTRPMLVINNQFPGPLIECSEGDTLNIAVQNNLDIDVSIHWHGIWQTGTPWMDGVTGVTQCPIAPGASFVYTFSVGHQFGTFWYHAHARSLAIDGISGPLIVHSPRDPLKRGRDFDDERILFISDWYHNISNVMLDGTLSPGGYNGSTAAPAANSALINGVGIFDCNFTNPGSKCRTPQKPLELSVAPNQRTRFRLIQAGGHAMFWFSADNHLLKVIEADSTGVAGPTGLHRLQFHNGQRYSVVIDTKNDTEGSSFYLRAAMDTDCWAWLAPGIPGPDATALAIVRVTSSPNAQVSNSKPKTKDWKDTVGGKCTDLNSDTLKPLVSKKACENVLGTLFFNTSLGTITRVNPKNASKIESLSRFFVDNTTWTTYRYKPILQDLLSGGRGSINRSDVAFLSLNQPGCYNIVINNLDSAIDHPLHLHGVDSYIVAHGPGKVGINNMNGLSLKVKNPLRRDTFVVGGGSHLVLRVKANNPGVWILHCHIAFHLAAGFAGMVVMQPSHLRKLSLPSENKQLCSGKTQANMDTTEPGRRMRLARRNSLTENPVMGPSVWKGLYFPNDREL